MLKSRLMKFQHAIVMVLELWIIFVTKQRDNANVMKMPSVGDVMNVNQDTGISLIVNHVSINIRYASVKSPN